MTLLRIRCIRYKISKVTNVFLSFAGNYMVLTLWHLMEVAGSSLYIRKSERIRCSKIKP